MAIQTQGFSGVIPEVESTFRAQRSISRPLEYGTLGHYSYGGFTGILPAGLAAVSEVFQFRWTDATRFCVVRSVTLDASVSTTFFTAGVPVQMDLVKASAWTVQGTGGTGVTPAALLKRRSTMGSTLVASGDMRIASTAALGAGTKTLETEAISTILAAGPTASPGTIFLPDTRLLNADVASGEHPLVLQANEGFVIRSVNVPATGTWQCAIRIVWSEISAY